MEDIRLIETVKKNTEEILDLIKSAALSAGRNSDDIELMAVTKTKPAEYAEAAYSAGIRLFGENRVSEMEEKFTQFHDDSRIHLIGHMQRNKAKKAAAVADSIDSIDKYETAFELDKWCSSYNRHINILLEFNTSGEDSKSGFSDENQLFEAVDKIRELKNLTIEGLMTIAPFTEDETAIRKSFRLLASLKEKLKSRHSDLSWKTLSMGMSSDFKIAIEEGSTIIRIGTKLFGSR